MKKDSDVVLKHKEVAISLAPVPEKLMDVALVVKANAALKRVIIKPSGIYIDDCLIGWSGTIGFSMHPRHIKRNNTWKYATETEQILAKIGVYAIQVARKNLKRPVPRSSFLKYKIGKAGRVEPSTAKHGPSKLSPAGVAR